MTEAVVAIDVNRPVSEALDCFFQYLIHHLPVVRDGKLAGMLGAADVMKLEYFVPKATADRAALPRRAAHDRAGHAQASRGAAAEHEHRRRGRAASSSQACTPRPWWTRRITCSAS
ncbi:MAG: CBS domain-containing protein [Comamonadaceae bacterium]|nr:CBS domain-containing protein [Comamonadaceae bacterium]